MNSIKNLMLSILLARFGVFGATSGSQAISTHYYEDQAHDLDANPTYCGMKGSDLDLSRVTAVSSLTKDECGSCLEIKSGSSLVYAMAVDKGGQGLDLNKSQFQSLSGSDTGHVNASWSATSSSNCAGIVNGGNNALPGLDRTSGESIATEPSPQENSYNAAQPNVPVSTKINPTQRIRDRFENISNTQNNKQGNRNSDSQYLQNTGQNLQQKNQQQFFYDSLNQQQDLQTSNQFSPQQNLYRTQQPEINSEQQSQLQYTHPQELPEAQEQQPGMFNMYQNQFPGFSYM